MKKSYLIVILMAALYSNSLVAKTYTLTPGWNLLGAYKAIPTSNVLANAEVKNILIYQDGVYLSTASNEFTTIPEGSGFFVYVDASSTITIEDSYNIPSSTVEKLDGNFNTTDSADWSILKIVDANVLVEMKTSTYSAEQLFTWSEATNYCVNLVIGNISGWRLPTAGEGHSISSVYLDGNQDYFKIGGLATSNYWSSSELIPEYAAYFTFLGAVYSSPNQGVTSKYRSYRAVCIKDSN